MSALAKPALAAAPSLAPPRAAPLVALALALSALLFPDCCLAGRHAAGFAMEVYGPICHSAR